MSNIHHGEAAACPVINVLMIDVGGGSVKLMVSGRRLVRSFDTGPSMTAADMASQAREAAEDWSYDVISLGYPGLVMDGRPVAEPPRVGAGWVGFDYAGALGRPVRIINDAAMQALAAYEGRRMLFVGLGTGLGSALIADGVLMPMELGTLRFDAKSSLHDQLAHESLQRLGLRRWRRNVTQCVRSLAAAFWVEEVVLGGGNAGRMGTLPRRWRTRANSHALLGAERLWSARKGVFGTPNGSLWHILGK